MEIKQRIQKLLEKAGVGIYEKEQLLALSLLASVAGESMFLLGPPGTAKSMIARRLKEMLKQKRCFEYLMSRFSTPDEIFGPVSIRKLKDEDCYERSVDGFLPWATVVFLDEIWKAGPAIQNALLTVLNEKVYQNGAQTLRLPLRGIIAASNELPAEGQGLEALWDRFLIRAVSNCITKEQTFYAMVTMDEAPTIEIPKSLLLDIDEIDGWQRQIAKVEVDYQILQAITSIRHRLKELSIQENVKPLDYYVSDRRWRKIIKVLRTSAFLNGRDKVDQSDLVLLVHMLWNSHTCIPQILDTVSSALFADMFAELEDMDRNTRGIVGNLAVKQQNADDQNFKVVNFLYYNIENYNGGDCFFPKSDYKLLQYNKDVEGLAYYDKSLGRNIIRRFDAINVLNPNNMHAGSESVRLSRTHDGIVIDGKAYHFTRRNDGDADSQYVPEYAELERMLDRLNQLDETLKQRVSQITGSVNIFLSTQDIALVTDNISALGNKIGELEIRISGGLLI